MVAWLTGVRPGCGELRPPPATTDGQSGPQARLLRSPNTPPHPCGRRVFDPCSRGDCPGSRGCTVGWAHLLAGVDG